MPPLAGNHREIKGKGTSLFDQRQIKYEELGSKEHLYPCVHCRFIYSSQNLEAAQVPMSR